MSEYKIFVERQERKQAAPCESFYKVYANFNDMQILEIATALPKNVHSTETLLEAFPCRLPEGVKQNVLNLGVLRRHLISNANSETELVDLCAEACHKVIPKVGIQARKIGFFVAAYDVNPFLSPGLSQLLIRSVGFNSYIRHVNVQGIASTAFPKTLEIAENYLAAHPNDYVLICVSGVSSYWFQNQIRGMKDVMEVGQIRRIKDGAKRRVELQKWIAVMEYFLFGDGVAAAVVSNDGEGLLFRKSVEVTNVGRRDYLAGYARILALNEPFRFGFYSHLGKEIPQLGVKYTGLALKRLLGKKMEETIKATKKLAIHTGSEKILKAMAEHHGIEHEKLKESYEVLREYGNLAGASLPFILERIISQNQLRDGDTLLMLGYGWGFSASAALLELKAR